MNSDFTVHSEFRLFISECREYEDAKYEKRWTTIGFNDRPILEKILHCIQSNIPFVVGGEDAIPTEFPHMVLLKMTTHKMNFY